MTNYSRLSDMSIQDDIIRAELYKRILDYLNDPKNHAHIRYYEIKPDEETRPDLVSQRHYGTHELSWLISLVSGLDDSCEPMMVGYEIDLPPQSVVRTMIREVKEIATTQT